MRVAITGGTGFLGRYVAEAIKNEGMVPVIITRTEPNDLDCLDEYCVTDYTEENLTKVLEDIDAVVHLAAKRATDSKIDSYKENEIITQNLYNACCRVDVKNIVYASTISVYSKKECLPWNEGQLPDPYSLYGISKLGCEYIGNLYSKKGLKIKNLRLAHLFGFNEKNNYMINKFFRQAHNKKQLMLDAKGVALREFLYAKDAASAIVCALKKEDLSGTLNIGSEEALTNQQVAETINKVFNNEGNLVIGEDLNEGITSSFMSSKKAEDILGYRAKYSFESAVKEISCLMEEMEDVPILY